MKIGILKSKGRLVISDRKYKKGEVICCDYVLKIPDKDTALIKKTAIKDYYFDWYGQALLPLGYSSLFNHSDTPNIDWEYNDEFQIVTFSATRAIKAGEELEFNYQWGKYPWNKNKPSKDTDK